MATTNQVKRLYRSESDRVVAGVAAGLAEYFAVDPVIIRLLFVVATIWGGFGIGVYIILWLILPNESAVQSSTEKTVEANAKEIEHRAKEFSKKVTKGVDSNKSRRWLGIILIVLGVWFVLGNFNIFFFRFDQFWPLLLVVVGIILLIRRS